MEFDKKKLILRQYLHGAEYFNALRAMEFAAKHHIGKRRDKVTPEFDHQLSIALFAITLPNLLFREEVIATIFLHDVREDYHVTDGEIRALFTNQAFADRVGRAVDKMTKEWRGVKRDETALFQAMSEDPIASIAKGCDRIHNFQSMIRVFTLAKQKSYIEEGIRLFLPMLKAARRHHPEQALAYENIKHMLLSQIDMIQAIHEAAEAK